MLVRMFATLALPLLLLAAPVRGADVTSELADLLRLGDIFAVMAVEGQTYGEDIQQEMFPTFEAPRWSASVAEIYAVDRLLPDFTGKMSEILSQSDVDLSPAVEFFRSALGQKVTALEVSARRALLDKAVADASRLKLGEMRATRDPRLDLIADFVAVNDLVEANVSGALNASYAFYLGLAESGGFRDSSEGEMLAEVWRQEASIRSETDDWIHSYLALAYASLGDAEITAYIAFSRTDAARELNRALLASFDVVFVDVSRRLGLAAGSILAGRDL